MRHMAIYIMKKTIKAIFIFGILFSIIYMIYQSDQLPSTNQHMEQASESSLSALRIRVFYLWCQEGQTERQFEFQNYLSVLSVITFIRPDVIEFYADVLPEPDDQFYNTWFEQLMSSYSFLVHKTVPVGVCTNVLRQKEFISSQLSVKTGIFVGVNTIFSPKIKKIITSHQLLAMNDTNEGFIIANKPLSPTQDLTNSSAAFSKYCGISSDPEVLKYMCIVHRITLYPRDSWESESSFSRLVRLLYYGSEVLQVPQPSYHHPIPNIAHIIWLGTKQLNFLFYLSVLSLVHIVKVEVIYIHVSDHPEGEFWEKVIKEPKVSVIRLESGYDVIYGHKLKTYVHQSDMLRARILQKYGGIYVDVDALFGNPIPDNLWFYDVVASLDWPQLYSNWPDYINNGVLMARPNAPFLQYYLAGFKDYKSDMFSYNGLLKPYKTFERHPNLVKIYDRLQVICSELRCHPTWVPNFRSPDMDHMVGPPLQWSDAVVFHFTYPTPAELQSDTAVLQSTGIWADLGKHVLEQAGKL